MDKFINYFDEDTKEIYQHYKKYIIDDNPIIHTDDFHKDILNQAKIHDYEGFKFEKSKNYEKAIFHHKVAYEFLVLYAMLPKITDANHQLAMTYFSIARISLLKEDLADFEYYYMEFLSSTLQDLLDLKNNPYLLDEINFLKDKIDDLFRIQSDKHQTLFDKLNHITEEVFKEFDALAERPEDIKVIRKSLNE